jgi:phosphatidate cytidylyltransferase
LRFQRELTAAVLIPLILALVVAGPAWAFSLVAGGAGVLALLEFYAMLTGAGLVVPRWAGVALFCACLTAAHRGAAPEVIVSAGATILLLPTLVMFSSPPEPVLLASSASAVFSTLYLTTGVTSFIGLRHLGWKPVVFLLAVVWAGDSAAYYVGRNWGKTKLAPVVSPKKTWEGFWGQMAGGTAMGGAAAALIAGGGQAPAGAALGCGVSALAVIGDLVESTFKRSCCVKDSGATLPGHGGFLDRLDSLLFAAPFLLLALYLSPEGLLR